MSLTADEMANKFLDEYIKFNSSITHNKRHCDENFSITYNKVFAYLDFVKKSDSLIARLRLSPQNSELKKFKGIWRSCTKKSEIGRWGPNETSVTEILMDDEAYIKQYIQVFEIAREANQ